MRKICAWLRKDEFNQIDMVMIFAAIGMYSEGRWMPSFLIFAAGLTANVILGAAGFKRNPEARERGE